MVNDKAAMKPYYDHAGIQIFLGDCRDILPHVTADAAITDPPYNAGFKYGPCVDDNRPDYEAWCGEWFRAIQAKTIALTCGHKNVAAWCRIKEPDWILCWWKPAAMGGSPVGVCNWEPIMFWGDPRKDIGRARVDVIRAPIIQIPSASLGGHPCPKPDAWARGLVAMFTKPGEVVMDPFAGSGTTLVAAKQLGRRAIGIEIEERYVEIAIKRLQQEVLPLEPDEFEPTQVNMLDDPEPR